MTATCVKPDGYVSHPYCCRSVCHETPIEFSDFYIWCLECGHPYRTRWHLFVAWLRKSRQLGYSWWIVARTARRPGRITFCQCCSHDF